MLSTRLLSSFIGLILLFGILTMGGMYTYIAFCLLATVGIYELFKALQQKEIRPILSIALLWNFLLFFSVEGGPFEHFFPPGKLQQILGFLFFLTMACLFFLMVFWHQQYRIIDAGCTLFGIVYVSYFFTFVPQTLFLQGGEFLVFIIFIGAWVTDTGAYFVGRFMGKRQLVPQISPKKTIAGGVGGVITTTLVMVIFGLLLLKIGKTTIPWVHFVILGMICGIVSQIGDWLASVIKRYTGVKDFGKIMPGHGGVLDRFDSILLIAPFVYYYIVIVIQDALF